MKKTIKNYLEEYGNYTFLEKDFNEVDAAILSMLSYINFSNIVSNTREDMISLEEASDIFYSKYSKKDIENNMVSVRSISYLLKYLANTNRFKDLLLFNYEYKVTFDMQFGAICILLPDKHVFVSYEGTDNYVSGWMEDCMLTYMFPTKAQIEAVDYINNVSGLFGPKIYVGGHSKGGNLALVAAMYAKWSVRKKIECIYNNDGPGLRKNEFNSREYRRISSKLKIFVPNSTVVGMLLNHDNNYIVVDSVNKGLMQHDAISWVVEEDHFKRCEISEFSKRVEKAIINWLDTMDDKKREKFTKSLFSILKKAEIEDLNEFRKTKLNSVIKILKETKNLDKETRNMLLGCFKDLLGEISSEKK